MGLGRWSSRWAKAVKPDVSYPRESTQRKERTSFLKLSSNLHIHVRLNK